MNRSTEAEDEDEAGDALFFHVSSMHEIPL